MIELFIATGNLHKLAEFEAIFQAAAVPVKVCGAAQIGGMPAVEETGATFAENARLKADALRSKAPPQSWVLADDSGLEVDVLGGAPGVFSSRYAGEQASDADNLQKLLLALKDVGPSHRTGRFRCSLCLIGPDKAVYFFNGTCEGKIALTPAGRAGFGYDPVFVPEGYSLSFAELGEEVKHGLSHRGHAAAALALFLKKQLG